MPRKRQTLFVLLHAYTTSDLKNKNKMAASLATVANGSMLRRYPLHYSGASAGVTMYASECVYAFPVTNESLRFPLK